VGTNGFPVYSPVEVLDVQAVVDVVIEDRPTVVAIDRPRSCAPRADCSRWRTPARVVNLRLPPDTRRKTCSRARTTPWILEGLARFDALAAHGGEVIEVLPTASGLAGGAGEASLPARPGLGRDWQLSAWKACPCANKTNDTLLPLRLPLVSTVWR
jgi:hypothetical protein